jgi:hypothetical protein
MTKERQMVNKTIDFSDGPQEAKALEKVNKIIGSSTNKLLYIVVTEDISYDAGFRYFATSKIDKVQTCLDIIGYEITNAQSSILKTWDDALELAVQENIDHISISFPWHRIISIKNVSYKGKSA